MPLDDEPEQCEAKMVRPMHRIRLDAARVVMDAAT